MHSFYSYRWQGQTFHHIHPNYNGVLNKIPICRPPFNCWYKTVRSSSLAMVFIVSEKYFLSKTLEFPENVFRSGPPDVLGQKVLKICSKFTGEHPCWTVNWIKMHCNFMEIALQCGCFPVNLLDIFRTLLTKTLMKGCFWFFNRLVSVSGNTW